MIFRYRGEEVIEMAEIGVSSYRRFLQGDKLALEEFIRTYSDALVRFAYSFVRNSAVAEDVAAESIAVFCMKAKRFADEAHMRAYLYKIARNRAMDYLRRHRNEVPLEDVENVLGSGDPEQTAMIKERDAAIYRCMLQLPEQYRAVLQMHYFDGFSIVGICTVLGKNSKQVYNLLSRARSALKQFLEKEGITDEDL